MADHSPKASDESSEGASDAPSTSMTLRLAVPAVAIGALTAIILILVSLVADRLQHLIWTDLPRSLGVGDTTGWWTFGVLTLVGFAVGVLVMLVPGHAGPDPATTGLVSAPLTLSVLPGLVVVIVVGLAGGVSLGPENPIIAINTAVVVALMARLWPAVPVPLAVLLSAAGTMGALFGTPVGAALIFTGTLAAAAGGGALWDRLFLPLVSAGTGSLVMVLFGKPVLAVSVPAYGTPRPVDLVSGIAIAVAAVLLGLVAVHLFPHAHRLFHLHDNPVLVLTAAGALLGVLGVVGGPDTLFKGLDEMKDLTRTADSMTTWHLALVTLVKLGALLIAASAGFRGGRIFPAVFLGVATGLTAHSLVNDIPLSLAVSAGVLGFVLAIARDGWLALFMAATAVGDVSVLPILCIIILPAWLLVSHQPPMLITPDPPPPPATTDGAAEGDDAR